MARSKSLHVLSASGLLGPDDPAPVETLNSSSEVPCIISCDHASRAVPAVLEQLGLPPEAFDLHIASDLGAGELTRRVATRLGVAAVLCGYSRLVVDCNRYLDDQTAFRDVSDGHLIPGNRNLTQQDRDARTDSIRRPYHAEIAAQLAQRTSAEVAPGIISIHSFTPRMDGFERPWHIGVLWDKDPRFALPLLEYFASQPGLVVGDNEPYSGRHPADFTIDHHGERSGLPCVSLEIRQDLLATEAGIERWTGIIENGLRPLLAQPGLFVTREDVQRER